MSANPNARLYGIGVGPGDPELLTLKAVRLIAAADVIAYPAPADGTDSMARAIAAPHIPAGKIELVIETPMIPGSFRLTTFMIVMRSRSQRIWMRVAASPCCAKGIRFCMARSCICLVVWRIAIKAS